MHTKRGSLNGCHLRPPAETMFMRGADSCALIDRFFRFYLDDDQLS